jgi:hypothetical protein
MGLLTFSINITVDGCVDHQEGIADDETGEPTPQRRGRHALPARALTQSSPIVRCANLTG